MNLNPSTPTIETPEILILTTTHSGGKQKGNDKGMLFVNGVLVLEEDEYICGEEIYWIANDLCTALRVNYSSIDEKVLPRNEGESLSDFYKRAKGTHKVNALPPTYSIMSFEPQSTK